MLTLRLMKELTRHFLAPVIPRKNKLSRGLWWEMPVHRPLKVKRIKALSSSSQPLNSKELAIIQPWLITRFRETTLTLKVTISGSSSLLVKGTNHSSQEHRASIQTNLSEFPKVALLWLKMTQRLLFKKVIRAIEPKKTTDWWNAIEAFKRSSFSEPQFDQVSLKLSLALSTSQGLVSPTVWALSLLRQEGQQRIRCLT